jgi:hypothetical protein
MVATLRGITESLREKSKSLSILSSDSKLLGLRVRNEINSSRKTMGRKNENCFELKVVGAYVGIDIPL